MKIPLLGLLALLTSCNPPPFKFDETLGPLVTIPNPYVTPTALPRKPPDSVIGERCDCATEEKK